VGIALLIAVSLGAKGQCVLTSVPCPPTPPSAPVPCGPSTYPCPRPVRPQPRPNPVGRGGANVAAPTPDPAIAETKTGDDFYYQGNWDAAIWHYRQALALHPNDPLLINRVTNALNNKRAAIEAAAKARLMAERQQYEEESERLANSFVGILENDFDASYQGNAQSAVLAQSLPKTGLDFSPPSRPVLVPAAEMEGHLSFTSPSGESEAKSEKPLMFPLFTHPLPPSTAAVKVLMTNQAQFAELDGQIERAKEALRRLIETNNAGNEERIEWEKESAEATTDAESLSVKLVLDLVGEQIDVMKKAKEKQAGKAMDKVLRAGDDAQKSEKALAKLEKLTEEQKRLETLKQTGRLTGKLNDLEEKTASMSDPKSKEFTREDFWDVISQLKAVEEKAGPSKDLLDSAYTIYRQAASLDHLAQIEETNDKILIAQKRLQTLIRQLEAKKQASKPPTPARKKQTPAEPHP
jgi:tetratricopeptide (TPR) repeat protein